MGVCMIAVGCGTYDVPPGQGGPGTPIPAAPYTITVNSQDPTSNVPITVSPADANGTTSGNSSFTLSYAAGTQVTLTAPTMSGLEVFEKWSGCAQSVGTSCVLTASSSTTVTAVYQPQITISLQPQDGVCCSGPWYMNVGATELIYLHTATINGLTDTNVSWSLAGPPGYSCANSACGTLTVSDGNEEYITPYPAPPYVTVTATSTFDPVASGSVVITLGTLAGASGAGVAALTVDTSATTHAISPLIYGVNGYGAGAALQAKIPFTMDRWGGDAAERYNYLLDLTNSGSDYYFENNPNSNTAFPGTSAVNTQIEGDEQYGATSLITVPMIGYVSQSPDPTGRAFACGFSITKYGAQQSSDPSNTDCGNGETPSGHPPINWGAPVQVGAFTVGTGPQRVTNPADTSLNVDASYTHTPPDATPVNPSFTSTWVNYLVGKYGTAANGGVGIYELSNEPEYWSGVHQDVHPFWETYDEVTNKGIAYATAIKTADSTAQVAGPVISGYQNYFYSTADQWAGYNFGDSADNYCYCYNSNPADRIAHGNVPFLAYYLQQMAAASATAGYRLLDYLDLHGYYAAAGTANTTAGDTSTQFAREDSTRFLWDPSYIDTNGNTDPNTLANASPAPVAIQLIPFMQNLVSANYPGTKTAITEYNFGGEESMSGAIAQAEAMAIMGWQGLDMASLWSEPLALSDSSYAPTQQAFNFFLNYDGAGSKFGDMSLNTNSIITGGLDQNGVVLPPYFGGSQLSIYAAKRTSDGAITAIVFNKTYQALTSTVTLTTTATTASVYQLSEANLTAITSQPAATVTNGVTTLTFPEQSITLIVFPQ